MLANQTESNGNKSLVELLCNKYGVDDWHYRNSLHKPLYQQKTCSIVERIATPDNHIVEIGCGIGDILVMLADVGFRSSTGIERDQKVYQVALDRINSLKINTINLLHQEYPQNINIKPNILLLINCMYFDYIQSSQEFGKELRRWMNYNGEPDSFLVETIDASYTSLEHTRLKGQPTEFNFYCRVSSEQVKSFFPEYYIFRTPSSDAYRIPKNIYLISKKDYSIPLEGLMELI